MNMTGISAGGTSAFQQLNESNASRKSVSESKVQSEIGNLIQKKQTLNKSRMQKDEIIKDERKTMLKIARLERKGSELDTKIYPESDLLVDWRDFNCNFASTHKEVTFKIKQLMKSYEDEMVDLRPYMIHSPYTSTTTDKFQKVLDIYRFMQLKTVIVVNPIDGSLQGTISRKDLFKYMAL